MNENVFVVLMAGGAGTRFWPLSRRCRPKQVLAIADGRPMIRSTVARLGGDVPIERIIVVTGEDQEGAILEALPEVPAGNVIAEPVPRNTAPCIALAAMTAMERDPDAVLLCLPADHVISPEKKFREVARRAVERADRAGTLVTFGVKPTWPSTGYGYIRRGKRVAPGVWRAKAFKEKPRRKRAKEFLASGKYRWNSGMFAWRADVFLREVETHLPELASGILKIREHPGGLAEVFPRLPAVSVDYGIMEKTDLAEMVQAGFEWDDVGSFEAIARLVKPDAEGNFAQGRLLALDSSGVVTVSPDGHLVAAIGVKDLIVVATEDATLVCRRRDAERVRELMDELPSKLR